MTWASVFATLGVVVASTAWLPWSLPLLALLWVVWGRS